MLVTIWRYLHYGNLICLLKHVVNTNLYLSVLRTFCELDLISSYTDGLLGSYPDLKQCFRNSTGKSSLIFFHCFHSLFHCVCVTLQASVVADRLNYMWDNDGFQIAFVYLRACNQELHQVPFLACGSELSNDNPILSATLEGRGLCCALQNIVESGLQKIKVPKNSNG